VTELAAAVSKMNTDVSEKLLHLKTTIKRSKEQHSADAACLKNIEEQMERIENSIE
jgi:hypothetical protein